jgi:DNA-binding LacI/PurR family transcriptional regulator
MRSKQAQLDSRLRLQIVEGNWHPGSRIPTYDELEKKFTVSRATLRQAVDVLQKDGFIYSAGRKGSFVSEHLPFQYRYGLVALAHRHVESRFWQVLKQQAQRITDDDTPRQMHVYTQIGGPTGQAQTQQLLDDIRSHRLAGLIFLGIGGLEDIKELRPWLGSMPMIAFTEQVPHPNMHRILLDHHAFATRGIEALMTLGCRRIAVFHFSEYVGHHDLPDLITRMGLQTRQSWHHAIAREFPQGARSVAHLLMEQPADQRPDGLIIGNDNMVEPVLGGLLDAGVTVGQDVHAVCHCNWPGPTVTLVPTVQLGYDMTQAMEQSMQLIDRTRQYACPGSVIQLAPLFQEEIQSSTTRA